MQSLSRPACAALMLIAAADLRAQDPRQAAEQGLKRAAMFYRTQVASHGGYVYYYSLDLKQRWGEGKANPEMAFVEPPGTPTVGMAYLRAHEATGDSFYLEAAVETATALVEGQLQSGGWSQVIHFAPVNNAGKYRTRKGGDRNNSSLDDGQTQSALKLLARVDRATGFRNARVHEAAMYGFDALLKAQFANGAFPQIWTAPAAVHPVLPASYPEYDWKTVGRVKNYWDYYTLNDGLPGTVAETLITAHEVYRDQKYLRALEKLGDFLLLAQMPDPQPGWCQQYNYQMKPIWARKFEPPAVTGHESQDAMRTLIRIARHTGNPKYLEPIPRALAYLKTCLLPDGRIARYYELQTNKPLYMNADYELTYDDSAAPSHYGWKQLARLDQIETLYNDAKASKPLPAPRSARSWEKDVRLALDSLDADGRWVSTYNGESLTGAPKFEKGFQYLSSAVFSRNITTLSEYLLAK